MTDGVRLVDAVVADIGTGDPAAACLYSGQTASRTTISGYGAMLDVYSGGVARDTTIYTGLVTVHSGGLVRNIIVDGDYARVFVSGGTVDSATVKTREIHVYAGGIINSAIVTTKDGMKIYSGGVASAAQIYGESNGFEVIGGLANDTTVYSGSWLSVKSGGAASGTVVKADGCIDVRAGVRVVDTVVERGGYMDVTVARDTLFTGTSAGRSFRYGDSVNGFAVNGSTTLTVGFGGQASQTSVKDGELVIGNGGTVRNTTLAALGRAVVSSGGSAGGGEVQKTAALTLLDQGKVTDLEIGTGGMFTMYGGELGGSIQISATAGAVRVAAESLIDFTVSEQRAGDAALLTNWNLISGREQADYTITVDSSQGIGTYKLATGAAGFSNTVTVKDTGDSTLGTLSVGASLTRGETVYTLLQNSGVLSLAITGNVEDHTAPSLVAITPSSTLPTNRVTVTASFRDNVAVTSTEYKIGDGAWQNCRGEVSLTENGMIYFRARDAAGNYSAEYSYEVTNIAPCFGEGELIDSLDIPAAGEIGRDGNTQDSFRLRLAYAGYYRVAGDFGALNGSFAIMDGKKSVASGTLKDGKLVFSKNNPALLSNAVEYQVVINNSDRGKSASDYLFSFEPEKVFDRGDNSDDWSDLKTAGASGKVADCGTVADVDSFEVSGWVGYGDAIDYKAITLKTAASLSFSLEAGDAAKFSVYRLNEKSGRYSLKTLQATTLKPDRESGQYAAETRNLLLTAGTYYIAMQSTNAAKGGSADYAIGLNGDSRMFDRGDNSDDWSDLKTAGAFGKVADCGTVASADSFGVGGWVGYGDAIDYMSITLETAASLSFSLGADDAAKFSVYRLNEKSGRYSLKTLQATTLKPDRESGQYLARTKNLLLTAGTYYIAMQSTNAAKGGSADYTIGLNGDTRIFPGGDNSDDTWKLAATQSDPASIGASLGGWVGYGDPADFRKFVLAEAGRLRLDVDAATAVALQNKELKLSCLDSKGKTIALSALDWNTFTGNKALAAGTYYLGVSCTNTKKYDTDYEVSLGMLA